ncbi:Piso0_002399 [Millerozyma farinosa CBS 7064]|uniref:Piso0_002399 protein n=1 Tax=Pichia sorbitophila (strain ATCC MYA-4447 / BCRC 22081 / CBS 7064 / NBRC 10061 / NRRL Y-12695) TaxID=559304 RepID=G8YCI2_PICSO|nr:Piso0_002399 [Millerozyma farinosa CBS 7064]
MEHLRPPDGARHINTTASRTQSPLRRRKPWKKLLYLKQAYPDNYTSETFLSQMKRNSSVTNYSYWKLVQDFALIVLHLSNILLVVLLFMGIYLYSWNASVPTVVGSCLSIAGFIVRDRIANVPKTASTVARDGTVADGKDVLVRPPMSMKTRQTPKLKSFFLLMFMLLVLTPVLSSLTKSTSSDSIWALCFILCVCNVIFHDYGMNTANEHYSPIISTNISFANAIVLASRLVSTRPVFCFTLLAVQINVLLPIFDYSLRKHYPKRHFHTILMITMLAIVHVLIVKLFTIKLLLAWITMQVSIAFFLPAYFLFLQKYKNELQGPWDPAKPIIRSN